MSIALGKNPSNHNQPLHLDTTNQLLVNDATNKEVLETIATNTLVNYSSVSNVVLSAGSPIYADSSPAPTTDNDGWLWSKIATGTDKLNYYFYSQGNTAMTLATIKSISANIKINNYQGTSSLPFLHIYTKMTGSGDSGSWYKSRITYTLSPNEKIFINEPIELWSVEPPTDKTNRQVECNVKQVVGSASPTEEILTIALGSDSGSPIGTSILVSQLNIEFKEGIKLKTKLI
jgi:hypothetical protein